MKKSVTLSEPAFGREAKPQAGNDAVRLPAVGATRREGTFL
jgi:hypothetical protein